MGSYLITVCKYTPYTTAMHATLCSRTPPSTYPGAFSINGNTKTLEGTTDDMGQLISPPNDVLSGHHGVEVRDATLRTSTG